MVNSRMILSEDFKWTFRMLQTNTKRRFYRNPQKLLFVLHRLHVNVNCHIVNRLLIYFSNIF